MDRLLHIVILFALAPFTMQENSEEGACECAVFPGHLSQSIIERTLQYNVTCNEEGNEKCQHLCVALAEGAKDKAPQMICEKLTTHVQDLLDADVFPCDYVRLKKGHNNFSRVELLLCAVVGVYAKICNATTWKFTGLRSAEPICCHERKSTPCSQFATVIE